MSRMTSLSLNSITVILNLHFANKNAVMLEQKMHEQYTQTRTIMWTEVSNINVNKLPFTCVFSLFIEF